MIYWTRLGGRIDVNGSSIDAPSRRTRSASDCMSTRTKAREFVAVVRSEAKLVRHPAKKAGLRGLIAVTAQGEHCDMTLISNAHIAGVGGERERRPLQGHLASMESGLGGRSQDVPDFQPSAKDFGPQWSPALAAGVSWGEARGGTVLEGGLNGVRPWRPESASRSQRPEVGLGRGAQRASMESSLGGRRQWLHGRGQRDDRFMPQWSPALTAGVRLLWGADAGFNILPQWSPALAAGVSRHQTRGAHSGAHTPP